MTSARKLAVLLAITVLTSGCKHRKVAIIPAAATAPPPPTRTIDQSAAALPAVPPPELPNIAPPSEQKPAQKPKRSTHRKKTQNTTETNKDQAAGTQQAASGEAPAVSPIGQITTTGERGATPSEQQIRESLSGTEKGLNDLKRQLSSSEQETVVQIRAFLQKARQALQQNDLEGAQTLATKAKVLLSELTKS
ncbi:hypothetical protein [Silvibacterium dinghuense]|uniref:Uncharacterized protein n=1 Tax=Silvibacterium dinghuense TaxID=1560006 RepID=A0A4Q1SGS6_9BACT|nr:hypothetical protein [Silvibacterium dinghuense]RXS96533.1 hypothetical protein ESZ00_00830 [Silvibacterium dinghuense]GGG91582.1 hypothetical protein GCM10011586_02730 [Silvibacterium dinghuense]